MPVNRTPGFRSDISIIDKHDGSEVALIETKMGGSPVEHERQLAEYLVLTKARLGLLVHPERTLLLRYDPVTRKARRVGYVSSREWLEPRDAPRTPLDFERQVYDALIRLRNLLAHGDLAHVPAMFVPDFAAALVDGELVAQTPSAA